MTTFARTMIHIGRLFLLLASCGWAAVDVAGQSKLPETVEVDLVFPHNDTYAPVALMPLVFAIQNFPTSRPLFLQIDFDIFHTPSWNTTVQQGIIFLNHANYSNNASTLHFVYDWTTRLNNTEGSWAMWWGVYSANCTDTGLAPGPLKLDLNYQRNLVHFSTKHGAQQPDLVAASKDGVCDKTTGVTFNITEVKEVSWFNRHSVDHDVCPILAPEAPKPNPCLAKVNATTASSILYDIQSKACMRGLNPNVTCPPEPQGQSAGTQTLPFSRGQISWLVLALAGLAKLV
ncbi:chitinase [Metarhizium guizhouense ARSEF 977]|uniref:Chitinase n=1 Tax=Metarhizium guizhouense (strain ARSEF 977) TaxID=1276136 RepID=A0A0B4GVV1_METGA|nr:chitinase [Metarhizium guizhouense ARSEF 977]